MAQVVFLDSSVLLNLLEVPHMCDDREKVLAKFERFRKQDTTFIFPITAVIETGNHIAHVAGGARRGCMGRFVGFLQMALDESAPWAVSGVGWDRDFLTALLDGGGDRMALLDFCTSGIGCGDAGLLLEIERYRAKIPGATPVQLWTLDRELQAYG